MKGTSWLLLLLMALATAYAFLAPGPTEPGGWREPEMARIVFFHLPSAFLTTALVFLNAFLGWRYLRTGLAEFDLRLAAATELSVITASLTMLTGMLFSRVQWGAWWQWDPRQTSFLFVLLLLAAATALRSAQTDDVRRARSSAAYSIVTLIPTVLLIFVYPRIPQIQQASFHPSATIQTGGFGRTDWLAILGIFALLSWTCALAYRARVRTGLLESEIELLYGNLETAGDDPASTRVVRPVSVPLERG